MTAASPFYKAALHAAFFLLLALCGVAIHAWLGQSFFNTSGHAWGSDDAYISYRYAHNLFAGYGLVFNPGERVEGYSNFLYTLLVTPAFFISPHAVYPFALVLNALLFGGTLLLFFRHVSVQLATAGWALAGAVLLALNPWMWANAASGLETLLVVFITTALWIAVENYLQRGHSAGWVLLLCVLSVLARVDGFLLPLAALLYAWLRGDNRLVLRILATLALTLVIYTALRYVYYQDVIANTYYNKVTGALWMRLQTGLAFVYEQSLLTGFWLLFLAVIVQVAIALRSRRPLVMLGFSGFFIILWLLYLLWIGGDIYFERFLLPLFPLGLYLLLKQISAHLGTRWIVPVTLLVLAVQSAGVIGNGRFEYMRHKHDGWIELGMFLGKNHPDAVIAVDAAGKIPFYSNLQTIDMLGLSDRHIGKLQMEGAAFVPGHVKFDPDYVFERRPDLIIAWVIRDRDLAWGLEENRYREHYDLRYLLNTTRMDRGPDNIVDVSNWPPSEVSNWMARGYNYAVLERKAGDSGNAD